jgi:Sec-independent protein translocase protein TatA
MSLIEIGVIVYLVILVFLARKNFRKVSRSLNKNIENF